MTLSSVRNQWSQYGQKEHDGFVAMLTWDRFEGWGRTREPESRAEDEFHNGLLLRYIRDASDMASRYLQRAIEILDRIDGENLINNPRYPRIDQPAARGRCICIRTFCDALLGAPFRNRDLKDAAPGFIEWSSEDDWHDLAASFYLRGVRLLMLSNELDEATRLLKAKKSFPEYQVHANVLRLLCAVKVFPCHDAELLESFDCVFDPFRVPNPQFEFFADAHNTRFELGLLHDKYFDSPDGQIDINRAIETISR